MHQLQPLLNCIANSKMSVTTASDYDDFAQRNQRPVVLAKHSSGDCYFDIKLMRVEPVTWQTRPAQTLRFQVDLARPFDAAKRIQSARVSITVKKRHRSVNSPQILGINPEATHVKMADHEITNGQSVGVAAGTPPTMPGSLTLSGNMSFGQKTSFSGDRLIHGFILPPGQPRKGHHEARWQMYEESRSKSGLPPSLSIIMIVESDDDFRVSAELCVSRWTGWAPVGMMKNFLAPLPNEPRQPGLLVRSNSSSGIGERALRAQDHITAFLDENEQKRRVFDSVVDKLFPSLLQEVTSVKYGTVLVLILQQANIPVVTRRPTSRGSSATGSSATELSWEGLTIKYSHRPDEEQLQFFDEPTQINIPCFPNKAYIGPKTFWGDTDGRVWVGNVGSPDGSITHGADLLPHPPAPECHELQLHDRIDFSPNDDHKEDEQAVLATVDFVGFPDVSNRDLNLASVWPATPGDDVKLKEAQAVEIKLARDIAAKFKRWRFGTTDKGQLNVLAALREIAFLRLYERFDVLGLPSWELDDDDNDPDYDFGDAVIQEPDRKENLYAAGRNRRRAAVSKGAVRLDGMDAVLFGGAAASTGEHALSTHQTVGKGWREAKLTA